MQPKQPVSLNGIEFDAIIDGTQIYSASVPEYPIDAGYSVSDNAALDAATLEMTLYVTATPVTWLHRHGVGEYRIQSICNQITDLYASREFITVVTADKVYSNMVIENLEIKHSPEIGYAREISVTMKQVTVTAASVTLVPAEYLRSGTSMQSVGSASNSAVAVNGSGSGGSGGSNVIYLDDPSFMLTEPTTGPETLAHRLGGMISSIDPGQVGGTIKGFIETGMSIIGLGE